MQFPEIFKVGSSVFPVKYKKGLKKSSNVRIRDGAVHMTISRYLRGKQLDETVEKFLKWAEKKLSKAEESFLKIEYKNGGRIVTHNKVYDLKILMGDGERCKTRLCDDLLEIYVPRSFFGENLKKKVKDLVDKAIIKDQTPYLEEVLDELNQLYFQERYNSCRFKRVSSRFGSCSTKRNINIAFRLLFAPREVFRYVCVHELAHLREMNHSKRFWGLVSDAMPNYKDSEKWLKNNGFMLG